MSTKRLVGKDGKVAKCTKGSAVNGDGATPLTDSYYVATTILGTGSGLPTGLEVGYIFKGDNTITPETGEVVIPLTFTDLCDVKSASLEFTKDEIDVTTLCDAIKTYRAGFSDATGSLEGVTTIGVTETIIGKFVPTVVQGADLSSVTISDIDGDTLFLIIEVNETSTVDEPTALYIAPTTFLSYSASAAVDGDQAYTSNFRITPDDDIKACFFELEQA
jgi:hypothetical protein